MEDNHMFKNGWRCLGITLMSFCSAMVQAAPGEYWEFTTKMEMAGMPFAMPATTVKICVPQGGERNPQHMQKKDDNCQVSDVKTSGNKVSWKVRCINEGKVMTGHGESTHERDRYHGYMQMRGEVDGQTMDMKNTYNARKIGGACDSDALVREMNKSIDKVCDSSGFNANTWITRADLFLKGNTCPGKKEPLCAAVRRDAARNAETYQLLIHTETTNGGLIASTCGLNLESTRAAVCRANRKGPLHFLKANCPAEAKEVMEWQRQNCEGRSYTTRATNGCDGSDGENSAPQPTRSSGRNNSGTQTHDASSDTPPPSGVNADAVLEGAKKLKGLFGF
jgi:hypothetical protein